MKHCRSKGMCCGAGGAQMWKEEEKGTIRVNAARVKEAEATGASLIVSNCPYCMTMLSDGVKANGREDDMRVLDIAELVAQSME
jgi:Fe-S oxidoreductase